MAATKKPPWLRVRGPSEKCLSDMKSMLDDLHLHTVCESAICPNVGTCFSKGTATFMILGNICTRNCGFCSVKHSTPLPVDHEEPLHVAQAAKKLNLKHVVITSVTRDDLPDGGAKQFAETIHQINRLLPDASTDVLIPDLRGSKENLKIVIDAKPTILAHNLETVPGLYKTARQYSSYKTSLKILEWSKEIDPDIYTKSGIMIGLGETREEVLQTMQDLRKVKCDFLTIGQYLRPTPSNVEVHEYIHPDIFDQYKEEGEKMGFAYVASAPFVRSSFHAEEALKHIQKK
ncbi:MAG: lipoyl synthase [Thermodesulfobacteriota bacterium]